MPCLKTLFDDLKTRLLTARDTLAPADQLRQLRDEINQADADSLMTLDELGELKELLAEAQARAIGAVGELKPRW